MALVVVYKGAVAVDPANAVAVSSVDTDVAVPGVKVGDFVVAQAPPTLEAGLVLQAVTVPADGTVRFRHTNASAGAINGASLNYNIAVFRMGMPGGEGISWAG